MAEDEQAKEKAGRFNYGIVKFTDVVEESKAKEMQEIVTLACEKWAAGDKPPSARNNEKCANQIATNLAKKFGPGWNAIVGEAFSFEISYTKATLLYMYFGGHLGITVWRTS